ncbi:hypothetical protein D9M73_250000 [compost metagenome]
MGFLFEVFDVAANDLVAVRFPPGQAGQPAGLAVRLPGRLVVACHAASRAIGSGGRGGAGGAARRR